MEGLVWVGLRWKREAAPAGAGEQRSAQREGGRRRQGACGAPRALGRQWERVRTNVLVTQMTGKIPYRQRRLGTVCCNSESHSVGQNWAVKQGSAYICCCENNKFEADPEVVSLNYLDDFQ